MIDTLHPHQIKTLESLREALRSGSRRPMVQAPTGAGKTVLAAAIVEGALSKGKRVIYLVPFLGLVDQTLSAFHRQGITSVGVIQGYHPATDASQPVQIASIQTLQRRALPPADLVLVDEAHRWFRFVGDWMKKPDWENVPFIGFSATPWTRALGKHYDKLIVAATTSELIKQHLLSSFRVFAPTHPDLSAVRIVAGDFHEGQLSEVMSQPVLVADIVSTWLVRGENRPTLLFAVDCAHARKLADQFEAAGVATGYVDARTPREERELIGKRLRGGQIKIVCNVFCLTTGVDWDVRCIILARPTRSEILYTQIIGRGLRNAPGKQDCLILDHSDTTTRLGFVTDIHHSTLDLGKRSASRAAKKDKPAPLPKECHGCSCLKPIGIHVCPNCGFAPERQSPIEEGAGQLVQLNGERKAKGEETPHTRQEVYSMLMSIESDRGYRTGFAKMRFKDRYGEWADGLLEVSKAPDAIFLNWEKSKRIAYHKRPKKVLDDAA